MTIAYRWKKASRSQSEGACVELAHADHESADLGAMRDSKNPNGPTLSVDLVPMLSAIRAGGLDR